MKLWKIRFYYKNRKQLYAIFHYCNKTNYFPVLKDDGFWAIYIISENKPKIGFSTYEVNIDYKLIFKSISFSKNYIEFSYSNGLILKMYKELTQEVIQFLENL